MKKASNVQSVILYILETCFFFCIVTENYLLYSDHQNVHCTLVKADVGFCSSYIYYCLNEAVERKMKRFFLDFCSKFCE